MQMRVGNGFDVHRFGEVTAGATVTIGGVPIPHARPLLAHSDGDVLVHALCDALLGALALGDIGQHFPDSDPRYRGISSLQLLQRVVALIAERGWSIVNVDLTLLAEAPRFAPFMQAIQTSLSGVLGVNIDQVSVKATTTEGLGFTGRKEGIACQAVAMVQRQVSV